MNFDKCTKCKNEFPLIVSGDDNNCPICGHSNEKNKITSAEVNVKKIDAKKVNNSESVDTAVLAGVIGAMIGMDNYEA